MYLNKDIGKMKKIVCFLLVMQNFFMLAQTKTVVTQYGEKVTIHPNANNGLTPNNGNIQMGGTLTEPATVIRASPDNTLAIKGLQTGTSADNIIVTDENGVLKTITKNDLPKGWLLDGNSNGALKAIGTNDVFDLPIETNGIEKMRVTSEGQVLINTTTPLTGGASAKLQLNNGTTAGVLQIKDGTEASGKVLTSDGNGLATWQRNIGNQTSNFKTFSCSIATALTLDYFVDTALPGIGPYFVPDTGKYELIFHSFFNNPKAANEMKSFYVSVFNNGSLISYDETYAFAASLSYINVHYPVIVAANAGDVITIKITAAGGAPLTITPALAPRNRLDVIFLGI